MSKIINFDVDIDMADRNKLLECLDYVNARADGHKRKVHPSGIYLQPMPTDPFHNVATIDHKEAEKMGYFKIDVLNNSIYEGIDTNEELDVLCAQTPMWELLLHSEIVSDLPHVNKHLYLMQEYKPQSIEQLAMLLAVIRPAKKHLVHESFETISKTIWDKPANGEYYYKKSHAIAYAMSVVVALNKHVNNLL